MVRHVLKITLLAALAAVGGFAIYKLEQKYSREAQLEARLRQLEEQREHLQQFVQRLTSEQRMAEIVVIEQVEQDSEVLSTTLMFLEYADGKPLPPRFFTIEGNVAHIDALVIKFERGFIEQDDPLRGHSLALFYRLYGDKQAPAEGFRIDDPGKPPAVYRTDSPDLYEFQRELWQNFWRLADDPEYRKEKGVRVAQGEGPWRYFYPEQVYTVSLDSDGGLNITSRPMDALYREFLGALEQSRGTQVRNGAAPLVP